MPELPEVETVAIALRDNLVGQKIASLSITELGRRALGGVAVDKLILGKKITAVGRKGKFLIVELDGKQAVIVHLRMTGRFYYQARTKSGKVQGFAVPAYLVNDRSGKPDTYVRLSLELEQGSLHFSDKRRFGTFHYVEAAADYPGLQRLGPDVLAAEFTPEYLLQRMRRMSKGIYAALMDQAVVAGIGNIYAAEILAHTRIHPLVPANKLSKIKLAEIVEFSKNIMQRAIALQGTTFSDFQTTTGQSGGFQKELLVYGKTETIVNGQEYKVEKLKIGGRSVYYIPKLQQI
jgi:formamidopyrimidine-DNA glycosylase